MPAPLADKQTRFLGSVLCVHMLLNLTLPVGGLSCGEVEEERYFYIMHRVGDSPSPYPKGAKRVVASGGVAPGGVHRSEAEVELYKKVYAMRGLEWPGDYDDNGMHRNVASFLTQSMDPQQGAHSRAFRGLVAWFYLNVFDGQPILSFASEDELVFRVPESWLQQNAAACIEHVPHMTEYGDDRVRPWAFLTALVVPLEHRITDPTPCANEERRAMTSLEVQSLIYDAHVRIDERLRSRSYHADLLAAEERRAEERAAERAAERRAMPLVNPF